MDKLSELNADVLRELIKSAPSAMIMINPSGEIVLANRQAEKLFLYDESELLKQPVELLVPERFRGPHPAQRNSFFRHPETRAMGAGRDLYGRKKNGLEVAIEIGLNPVETPTGNFVLAAIVDITERKRAEERFRSVVEAAPNAMIMVGSDGKIALANRQTEVLFGYERSKMLGQPIEMLVPERFRAAHPGKRSAFFKDPQTRAMGEGRDLFGRRIDGSEVAIEIGLNPIETSEGNFVLASIIDITERQRNAALTASREAALEASRLKSQFLANMSHEIRTPMNGIIGMTELLLETPMNSSQRDYLETISRSAESMLTVINDILDFSRIEAGKLDLVPAEFDLSELLRDKARVFEFFARQKNLSFRIESQDFPTSLVGDSVRIGQVLNNLLGNALKFTLTGEVALVVSVKTESAERVQLLFEVRDTGQGVPEKSLSLLFQMFSQAAPPGTRRLEGTGLGLSISKRLVELMGGAIGVKSEPGKGSNFWFSLGLPKGRSVEMLAKEKAAPTPVPEPTRMLGRILVAEDSGVNQKLISAMLRRLGYEIQVEPDGKRALEALEKESFDLVLMDCQMPVLDGFEATRAIRASQEERIRGIPIIAMTAAAIKGDREMCLESGMSDYMSKPIHLEDLRVMLEKWIKILAVP